MIDAHLSIIGPEAHHDEVRICGTPEGLTSLRDAIDAALRDGIGATLGLPDDGEGYWLFVHRLTEEESRAAPHTYLADYAQRSPDDYALLSRLYPRESALAEKLLALAPTPTDDNAPG